MHLDGVQVSLELLEQESLNGDVKTLLGIERVMEA
jgi:hypothetical protein